MILVCLLLLFGVVHSSDWTVNFNNNAKCCDDSGGPCNVTAIEEQDYNPRAMLAELRELVSSSSPIPDSASLEAKWGLSGSLTDARVWVAGNGETQHATLADFINRLRSVTRNVGHRIIAVMPHGPQLHFVLAGLTDAPASNSKFHTTSDGSSGSATVTYTSSATPCCSAAAFGGSWSKSCTNAKYKADSLSNLNGGCDTWGGASCTLTADCKTMSGGTKTTSFTNSDTAFYGLDANPQYWYSPTANLANIDGTLQGG
eukprot:TRINITY_DN54771_c0_g3_i1.p1 TRINITY_DN54771_c0_g3~~TRINITY_DN54771_c0_g3_i1.p1  ORF type:complete len:258 (-),score=41.74 TRINITY_DN54771_c0_g3_i1:118-891(-)